MTFTDRRFIAPMALGVMVAMTTACGAAADESAPPTLAFEEVTTTASEPGPDDANADPDGDADGTMDTTAAAAASPSPAPAAADRSGPPSPEFTPEMLEGMLGTEGGRAVLVESIAAETGLDPEAATCLLDTVPLELLSDAAESFLAGQSDAGFFSADQLSEVGPILDSCGVGAENIGP